jgi:hypothetical protein
VLEQLKTLVDRAIESSGVSRRGLARWRLPGEFTTEEMWSLAFDVVRAVRIDHHDVYATYLRERTIASLVLDRVIAKPETSMVDIVQDLRRLAEEENEWLIEVPILRAIPPRETVPLGDRAMLVVSDQEREWSMWGSHLSDVWAVKRHFGDELSIRTRWLSRPSADFVDVDTQMTSALLLVESGTEELAVDIALNRARLAVSMWCVLKRPERTAGRWPLWPGAGAHGPGAHFTFGIIHKLYEPRNQLTGGAARRGASVYEHGPYRLSKSDAQLSAPFHAMHEARSGNTCAMALLAAARWLYLADHEPNDLERVERLLCVWNARAALCDRTGKGQGGMVERWDRLASNARVEAHLRRFGYQTQEIRDAFAWAHALRDLTAHRADSVLIGLDYPAQRNIQLHHHRALNRRELALPVVTSSWPILLEAVRFATNRLTLQAIANGWDENVFHARLNPRRTRRRSRR